MNIKTHFMTERELKGGQKQTNKGGVQDKRYIFIGASVTGHENEPTFVFVVNWRRQ